MPWFSYLITSIEAGKALASRSWRLADDRSRFIEEDLQVIHNLASMSEPAFRSLVDHS
jgi:hypothetical protein